MSRIITNIWKFVSVALAISALVAALSANADTVTSGRAFPSTHEAGESANYTLVFTTPTGAVEGSTITVEFEVNFDTASLTEDDVDLEDDGVDLTTAPDCSGTEESSVAIAADVVTLTICAGDGGAITAGSEITIEIGANATSSGTGSNQVGNPGAEGTYYISVAGSFGDSGSFAIPIGGDDSIDVTATVSQGGGGGPNDGGCGDATTPTISGITVSSVSDTEAIISWTTDEDADSEVNYGQTDAYELGTEFASSLVTSHAITLEELSEATEYHFEIRSEDLCGNEAVSSDETFTTADVTACTNSNIEVVDIGETTARVTWDTDESATSLVEYGLDTSYGTTVSDGTFVTEHSIILTDLSEATTYHYRVTCEDASANASVSDDGEFTTTEDDAPANVSDLVADAGDGTCDLSWSNPPDEDLAGVLALICEDDYPSSPTDNDCSETFDDLAEAFTDSGLTNGTTYYYGLFAYDEAGQYASGTLVDCTPEEVSEAAADCGNGLTEEGEACDDGDANGTICTPDYSASCSYCSTSCAEVTVSGAFCGDGVCDEAEGEDATSCPSDCEGDEGGGEAACGNDAVEEGEACDDGDANGTICTPDYSASCSYCSTSCAEVTVSGAFCGDGACDEAEDAQTCAMDCGEETTVASKAAQYGLSIFAAEETIELTFDAKDIVDVLTDTVVAFRLSSESFAQQEVDHVLLMVGGGLYLMSLEDEDYRAEISTPDEVSSSQGAITIFFTDGTSRSLTFRVDALAWGYSYETADHEEQRIGHSTVTLFEKSSGTYGVWDASPYNQNNPVTTRSDGAFAWYVPNGSYRVEAGKDEYSDAAIYITVSNNIVNPLMLMTPVTMVEEIIETVTPDVVEEALKAIRETQGVKEAAAIAAPIAIVTAVASTIVLVIAFDLLPLLQYLLTSPILFFWRRKRKAYGVVYNAYSKVQIDLAIVRLYRLPKRELESGVQAAPGDYRVVVTKPGLVRTRVTDKEGKFAFLVQPGDYRIVVTKPGFLFPSQYLKEVKEDGMYLDVYHAETIHVTEKDVTITPNIPIDPVTDMRAHTPWHIKWMKRLRTMQHVVAITGVLLAMYVFIVRPTLWTLGLAAAQIVIYLLVRRLVRARKPKSWGIVYDKSTGRPLENAIVRIFEPKYHKLLETNITDSRGRYTALLGPNQYYSTYEKIGYETVEIKPIDYSQRKEVTELSLDVELPPVTTSETSGDQNKKEV